MAHRVRVTAAMPDELSSIPETDMMEGKHKLLQVVL